MESGSLMYGFVCCWSHPCGSWAITWGLKEASGPWGIGPLKILHVSSTSTTFLMSENGKVVGRTENNCLAWGTLGASQKLQDDVSGSRKIWVCWSCHAFFLAQEEHTWVSTPPEGMKATEEWILAVSNTTPSLTRWKWGTERRDWPRGTEQVQPRFFQGQAFEK